MRNFPLLLMILLLSHPAVARAEAQGCSFIHATRLGSADGDQAHVLWVSILGKPCAASVITVEVRSRDRVLFSKTLPMAVAIGDGPDGFLRPLAGQYVRGIVPFRIGRHPAPNHDVDYPLTTDHVGPDRRNAIRHFNGWAFTLAWKSGSQTYAFDPRSRGYVLIETIDAG